MLEFVTEYFLWIKALHVIFVISWMAGLWRVARLYVYHVDATAEQAAMLLVMERRVLKIIMTPAMILVFIFGGLMIYFYVANGEFKTMHWLHLKLFFVLLLAGLHGFLAATYKKFLRGENTHSAKFYKIINEVPTLLMIFIVILVIVKPAI